MLFDVFDNRTRVTGELVALDPIHIGSSAKQSLNPVELDLSVLKDAAGNPVIPGSSIKGVVRSGFERVMRAALPDTAEEKNRGACFVFGTENCIAEIVKNKKGYTPEEIYRKSCPTCRLFGGLGIAGKLRFKDAAYISADGRPCMYEKRDGVAINRDTGSVAGNAKFDYEIVPRGSRFRFTLIAENLDAAQQKQFQLVLALLEGTLIPGDYLAFGGKTTRGLGRMRLENRQDIFTDAAKMRAELASMGLTEGEG